MKIRNIKGIAEKLPVAVNNNHSDNCMCLGCRLIQENEKCLYVVLSTDLDISECCEVDIEKINECITKWAEEGHYHRDTRLSHIIAKSGCVRWKGVSDDRIS